MKKYVAGVGEVEMTADEESSFLAQQQLDQNKPVPPEQVRANTFQADVARADLLTRLRSASPAQIDTFIDNNVTTLAQVRALLKALLKAVATDPRA